MIVCLTLWSSCAGAAVLRYVDSPHVGVDTLVVDTRPLQSCLQRTFAGAHCLPATDLLGPHGALPNFADLLWAFGTAGLSGQKTVLVIGARPEQRDFVAGLLYLAGQHRVQILAEPVVEALAQGPISAGPGRVRGIVANTLYVATMRDKQIDLVSDLHRLLRAHANVTIVDGRPAADYRQGHIPRAINVPVDTLDAISLRTSVFHSAASRPARDSIVYGNGPMDSIALFARLRAAGAQVHVLIGGWRAWVDANGDSTPDSPVATRQHVESAAHMVRVVGALMVLCAIVLFAATLVTRKGQRWM